MKIVRIWKNIHFKKGSDFSFLNGSNLKYIHFVKRNKEEKWKQEKKKKEKNPVWAKQEKNKKERKKKKEKERGKRNTKE